MLSLILTGQNAENNLEMPGQGEICKKKSFFIQSYLERMRLCLQSSLPDQVEFMIIFKN